MTKIKYFHDEEHHNLKAPSIIIPYIIETINPKSVVDVGCGIGTFLHVFKKNGVSDVIGLDGEWVNTELAEKYIDLNELKIVDLEERIDLGRKFDLAISLEVAEHIKESSADIFVENLTNLSDVIVFSAAFPGQGGQNHINEQWPNYWQEKFNRYGFSFYDVLRPVFWNNKDIDIWYRQNVFLVMKNGQEAIAEKIKGKTDKNRIINYIHPEIFESQLAYTSELEKSQSELENYRKGKADFMTYTKMNLKYLLRKMNLYKK